MVVAEAAAAEAVKEAAPMMEAPIPGLLSNRARRLPGAEAEVPWMTTKTISHSEPKEVKGAWHRLPHLLTRICAVILGFWCVPFSALAEGGGFPRYLPAGKDGGTAAVVVQRGALGFTKQCLVSHPDSDEGVRELIRELSALVSEAGGGRQDIVKLNLYASEKVYATLPKRSAFLAEFWEKDRIPAITIVPSELPGEATVGGDAVFNLEGQSQSNIGVGVIPAEDDIVFVSGKASSGELEFAVGDTMRELMVVLESLGLGEEDVIQVKAFLQPMQEWEVVQDTIVAGFTGRAAPPSVYVHWNSASRATEIELIARASRSENTKERISYFTPPGEKGSPVYSRVALIHAQEVVFFGGVVADTSLSALEETEFVFRRLKATIEASGSSLLHLAKATYYVGNDEVSRALNELRPRYYDPARPPAASKVGVPSVGPPNRNLLIDLIGVTKD